MGAVGIERNLKHEKNETEKDQKWNVLLIHNVT
jgi:hypothetical protein